MNCSKQLTPPVFLHVGLPKCASTYFQKCVFPRLANIDQERSARLHQILISAIRRDTDNFDDNAGRDVQALFNGADGNTLLVSNETFIGKESMFMRNAGRNARLFRHFLPHARVIIFIRRQDEFIESSYKTAVLKGAKVSAAKYCNLGNLDLSNVPGRYVDLGKTVTDYRAFDLLELVGRYIELFGKGSVLVIAYEDFVTERQKIYERLEKFLNTRIVGTPPAEGVNVGPSQVRFKSQLMLNRLRPKKVNNVVKRSVAWALHRSIAMIVLATELFYVRPARALTRNQKNKILEYHRPRNRELASLLGMDLEKWGYF